MGVFSRVTEYTHADRRDFVIYTDLIGRQRVLERDTSVTWVAQGALGLVVRVRDVGDERALEGWLMKLAGSLNPCRNLWFPMEELDEPDELFKSFVGRKPQFLLFE